MSLGSSQVGSAVKLPDLQWAIHSPKCLSCEYLHKIHFSRWFFIKLRGSIHANAQDPLLPHCRSGDLCVAHDYNVYAVTFVQSWKSVSICGQPVCALHVQPANPNIWMMTQEAVELSAQPIISNLPLWQGFICPWRLLCATWTREEEVSSFRAQQTCPRRVLRAHIWLLQQELLLIEVQPPEASFKRNKFHIWAFKFYWWLTSFVSYKILDPCMTWTDYFYLK